ncbi:MAG: hypothetical protein K8M05_06490 [Deltaproteobacteria bacterium]|nr:hypothetical protein [Kofleriaceae bacterium]
MTRAIAARLGVVAGAVAGLWACASSETPDVGLEALALTSVEPGVVITGTTLAIRGDSFVAAEWGASTLRLRGMAGGRSVDVALPAEFVDYDNMTAQVDADVVAALGATGQVSRFSGEAVIEVVSAVDGETYTSGALTLSLDVATELTPEIASVQTGGLLFVNDAVLVTGRGMLLGGNEGDTVARVTGCFRATGGTTCTPVTEEVIGLQPAAPFSRDEASFRFVPAIAGIREGLFMGQVVIENRHLGGNTIAAAPVAVSYDLVSAEVFQVTPPVASLGQYVMIDGGGFVGGEAGASTEVRLVGTFLPTGQAQGAPVDLLLIPEFETGNRVRYVISPSDALGMAIDLRTVTGTFTGTIQPIVRYQGDMVVGPTRNVTLGIAPVKQVVFIDFRPSYVESLRTFGLRAVDQAIRARVLDVVRDAFRTVNLELRTEPPTDFALFSIVEIHGPDPNNQGLFGYDNSPGKDVNNIRLHDRLGGVNAATQQDGYPGYGGVFIESLMGFSLHPASGESLPGAEQLFDDLFDPFRPDRGEIIVSKDLAGGLPAIDGAVCPASDRRARIGCAVWAMGSLIGTTLAHEIGHSLGLANPFGDGFHNFGDEPNRLMDGGADRPLAERAIIQGQGPADFCEDEYLYLRQILPSSEPADTSPRPRC